ncbi:hypothetical protein B0H11DRAFT_2319204 [Mycena galericulata]|nr:hypothetical protein B0H11DRAFT_2219145 [Mycena galericulata]KAJ7507330.1 hypothetical protein B0H11DRAFT_2319204 [Mycena galericulata]
MSISHSHTDDPLIRIAPNPDSLYEDVQYLSRHQYHHPPSVTQALDDEVSVLDIIDRAVTRHWAPYLNREEIPVNATFSAAPQSEYYGAVTLPDGQRLHRSVALNCLRIFKNPETGLPYSVSCHEVTHHLEATPDETLWSQELYYPSNERLHREMASMSTAPAPQADEDVGFPVHATPIPPPLPTPDERLTTRIPENEQEDDEPRPVFRFGAISPVPNEALAAWRADLTPLLRTDHGDPCERPAEGTLSPDPDETPRMPSSLVRPASRGAKLVLALDYNHLEEEIRQRVRQELTLPGDPFGSPLTASSTDDEPPALAPAEIATTSEETILEHPRWMPSLSQSPRQPLRPGTPHPRVDLHANGEVQRTLGEALDPILAELLLTSRTGNPTGGTRVRTPLEILADIAEQRRAEEEAEIQQAMQREIQRAEKARDDERLATLVFAKFTHSPGRPDHHPNAEDAAFARFSPAVILSRAAALPPPSFDDLQGRVVDREEWSSSPPDSLASTDSIEYSYSPPTVPGPDFTPTSERVLRQTPEATILNPQPQNRSPSDPVAPYDVAPQFQSYEESDAEQLVDLRAWTNDGHEHQAAHMRRENEDCGHPLRHALELLHGPLRHLIDYPAMVQEAIHDFRPLTPLPIAPTTFDDGYPSSPDFTQVASSLDFSLPPSQPAPGSDECSAGDSNTMDTNGPTKRKNPEGEEGGLNQNGARKRFRKFNGDFLRRQVIEREALKATKLMDQEVVCLVAGARLAWLDGLRRIEDLVWHRYDLTEVRQRYTEIDRNYAHTTTTAYQRDFPPRYVEHSLLFDADAAKAQTLYNVLHHHRRHELATLMQDLFAIRFRDEYVVSQLLNAGYLEQIYPDGEIPYWELLGVPPPSDYPMFDTDDWSSDSDMDDLGYPLTEAFRSPGAVSMPSPPSSDSDSLYGAESFAILRGDDITFPGTVDVDA